MTSGAAGPRETIERLVSFRGRWPGTSAEHDAARYLAGKLEALGRPAQIEPIRVRPAYHLTHALHAALAVLASVVSVYVAPLGVVILLLVAVSMYLDLTGRLYLLRLLMPRQPSQNVTSPGSRPDAAARLVLTAHYDAARSGLMFARWSRPPGRLRKALSRLGGPIDAVFWTVVVVLMFTVGRLFIGQDSTLYTAAQFVPTVLLIVAVVLFVDIALSEVVPGASDNASGVAATLELARRLSHAPPDEHLDIWVVFTGAKEGLMLGMREWIRSHAAELDKRWTFFVNIDNVGRGAVRYVTGEGFVVISQPDARMVELCSAVGNARPYIWRLGTDGTIPITRGYSSITICCTDEHDRVPNFHRHTDTPDRIEHETVERVVKFVEKLVRRIDAELVPSIFPTLSPRERRSVQRRTDG
jgi:hypothetical protein